MLSRVADTLYWMSRYLERAEHTARLLDVNLELMLDYSPLSAAARWARMHQALWAAPPPPPKTSDPYEITRHLTFDASNPASVVGCIASARENARQVRDLISSDTWEQLNRLYLLVRRSDIESIWHTGPHEFFRTVIDGVTLSRGITTNTMCHDGGWLFIQVGRFLERATAITSLLDAHAPSLLEPRLPQTAPEADLEWVGLLRCGLALEPYCKVHSPEPRAERIIEFLLLDPEFPHSVRFAADQMVRSLEKIAELSSKGRADRLERVAGRLKALLHFGSIEEVLAGGLRSYLEEIRKHCLQIHHAIQQQYISYPIETALA